MKALLLVALLASSAQAITVNPASAVTADSDNTGLTIPYRDANGAFSMGALTATSVTNSGAQSAASMSVSTLTVDTNTLKTDAGKVGIGTASPCSTCTLHVAGGASVTGGLEVSAGTSSMFRVRASDGVSYFGPVPNTSDVASGGLAIGAANFFINGDDTTLNGHSIIFGSSAGARLATVSSRWLTANRIVELGNGSSSFVGVASAGGLGVYSRTKAQLLAITPIIGDLYYCSDCADATSGKPTVVIATGTSAGNFGTLPIGVFQ